MNTTQAQQKALDDALVSPADRIEFGKYNMTLKTDIKPKEATFQVVLDALALTPFYQAFIITAEDKSLKTFYWNMTFSLSSELLDTLETSSTSLIFVCPVLKSSGIENKEAKKTNKMSYPRFTKIIIDYFVSKYQSISRRNKMFWHTNRDDTMFTSMRCISGHEDTQVYGTILPKELTNQAMLESNAYQTYYAFAFGEKAPKPKYVRKKADPNTSPKQKLVQATKGTRLKSKSKVAKTDKKMKPAKKPKAKGLDVLSKVVLSEAEQLKLDTKRSKTQFHSSHASGSGDGVDTQSKVPDKQQRKASGTDEGTGTKPGVPDVPIYESKSKERILGKRDEEMMAMMVMMMMLMMMINNKVMTCMTMMKRLIVRTKSDRIKIPILDHSTIEYYEEEEETIYDEETMYDDEDDEVTKELYEDVNVNLGNKDADMTDADLETTTSLLALLDFASVFKFNERVTNLEKDLSEMKQVDQYAQSLSSIHVIVDRYMDTKLGEAINKAIQAHNFDCKEEAQAEKREYIVLDDSTKNVIESLEVAVLTRSSSQPQSSYEAAATLSEFELTKILIDKMDKNKSFDVADYKRELYDALVKSYNTDKDIFESYGEVFSLKRSRDERDKDRDPSAGSDRGMKRRKSSKDAESSRDSRHATRLRVRQGDSDEQPADKEVTKADCQVVRAEEPPTSFDELNDTSFYFSTFVMNRLKIPNLTQEILDGPSFNLLKGICKSITELEYHLEECFKATTKLLDWHNPENKSYPFDLRKPLPLIQDHRGFQFIPKDYFINKDLEYLKGGNLSRRYSTYVTKTKATTYELKWIKDLVPELWSPVQLKYDQHAYLGTSHWGPKRQSFYGYASNLTSSKDVYSRRRIIAVTRLKIIKKYNYGHLEEIEVRRDDQKLYKFKEGDFKRLRL
ncbi:hypothetical protein Tco_1206609 [Tanacetum coccineum]